MEKAQVKDAYKEKDVAPPSPNSRGKLYTIANALKHRHKRQQCLTFHMSCLAAGAKHYITSRPVSFKSRSAVVSFFEIEDRFTPDHIL